MLVGGEVPEGSIGFYWVLLGFTGFYGILLSSKGLTGFQWVLMGFTVCILSVV